MHNKNYSNLKSWKKGQSGNPAGRTHGSKNVSTIVRKLLEQDGKGMTDDQIEHLIMTLTESSSMLLNQKVVPKTGGGKSSSPRYHCYRKGCEGVNKRSLGIGETHEAWLAMLRHVQAS
ncbi:MAG TPA: DUF5681 domain-containing protein [Candidatus Saccharimonadales bacterium]|nr:DUF5681 domain-containing protein [Candidatus Saccharimonadales bacterium]